MVVLTNTLPQHSVGRDRQISTGARLSWWREWAPGPTRLHGEIPSQKKKVKKKQCSSCCYSVSLECPPHTHILCPCSPACGRAILKAVEPLKDGSRSLGVGLCRSYPLLVPACFLFPMGCPVNMLLLPWLMKLFCPPTIMDWIPLKLSQNKYPTFKFLSSVWVGGTKIMHTVLLCDDFSIIFGSMSVMPSPSFYSNASFAYCVTTLSKPSWQRRPRCTKHPVTLYQTFNEWLHTLKESESESGLTHTVWVPGPSMMDALS